MPHHQHRGLPPSNYVQTWSSSRNLIHFINTAAEASHLQEPHKKKTNYKQGLLHEVMMSHLKYFYCCHRNDMKSLPGGNNLDRTVHSHSYPTQPSLSLPLFDLKTCIHTKRQTGMNFYACQHRGVCAPCQLLLAKACTGLHNIYIYTYMYIYLYIYDSAILHRSMLRMLTHGTRDNCRPI